MSTAFDDTFREISKRQDDSEAAAREHHDALERRIEVETAEKAQALTTVVELLGAKADREEMAALIDAKADASSMTDALAHKATVAELRQAIERLVGSDRAEGARRADHALSHT